MNSEKLINKISKFLLLANITVGIVFISLGFLPNQESVKIQDAVKQKLVTVKLNSTGQHSGKSMQVTLKNLTGKTQHIQFPAGTVFIADTSSEQNIYMPEDAMIVLQAKESKTTTMEGYCCEPNDRSPKEHSTFKLSYTDNKDLLALNKIVKGKKLSEDIKQTAVWATINKELSPINEYNDHESGSSSDPADIARLRQAMSTEMSIPDSWYNTQQNISMDANRRILIEPLEISGAITIKINGNTTLKEVIKNEKGEVIDDDMKPYTINKTGNLTYSFNLKVRGWEVGKYYVVVTANNKEVLKQEFVIN
ncbi:MAG: hypothetical protein NT150_03865 [Bacteroidetes bacterium]|nr:hypothetical protein [Bacteroidota bacterium]